MFPAKGKAKFSGKPPLGFVADRSGFAQRNANWRSNMDDEDVMVDEKDPIEEYEREILNGAMEYASCWQRSEDEGWFFPDDDDEEETETE